MLLKGYLYLISFLYLLSFTSCVYFNTFYNAESSFDNAVKIIEDSPLRENEEIPPQAKKLLNTAIQNSNIVIEKYSDSKYIDDALFILGKSHFYKNEAALAEKYFNKIIGDHKDSELLFITQFWLLYTHLRMGDFSKVEKSIVNLRTIAKSKESEYILYNIEAELLVEKGQIGQAYKYFELAAQKTTNNSQKTFLYQKLCSLSEQENDIKNLVYFLDQLSKYAPNKQKREAKMNWIRYQRELGNYDDIIVEIESLLEQSEYQQDKLKLELERAKVYIAINEIDLAKEFINYILEEYEKKDETAEAYYLLGQLALKRNLDIELAKTYFEQSKLERSSSKHGKISNDLLKKIEDYQILLDDYQANVNSDEFKQENNTSSDFPMPSETNNISSDSMLFNIAEFLLYDFNQNNLAMNRFKELVNNYQKSKLRAQSLYILSYYFPDGLWLKTLKEEYPNSEYLNLSDQSVTRENKISELEKDYDLGWEKLSVSPRVAFDYYKQMQNQYNDSLSLYMLGWISDQYMYDLTSSIKYYRLFLDKYESNKLSDEIQRRLRQLKDNINIEIELIEQKKNYGIAVEYFQSDFSLDSAKAYLTKSSKGQKSYYKKASQALKYAIDSYEKLLNDMIKIDTLITDKEVIRMADIFNYDFNMTDSAIYYYRKVIDNYSEPSSIYNAYLELSEIDENDVWASKLKQNFPDSSFTLDSNKKKLEIIERSTLTSFKNELENLNQKYKSDLTLFDGLFEDENNDKIKNEDSLKTNPLDFEGIDIDLDIFNDD